jgi:hypothetical protein
VGVTTTHHVAVTLMGGRYPFVPVCSCGWTTRGFVADHAAQTLADDHAANSQNGSRTMATFEVVVKVDALDVREAFTVTALDEWKARTIAVSEYLRSPAKHPDFSGSSVEYEVTRA